MAYIVIIRNPPGPEMHILKNGNTSFFGKPRRFLNKEVAQAAAAELADNLAMNSHKGTVVVRKV